MIENESTRIEDPDAAAEEAWEVHDRAEMMMNLGQENPNAKQLEAASLSIEDMQNQITGIKQAIAEIQARLPAYEKAVDAMQALTEHITGKKI